MTTVTDTLPLRETDRVLTNAERAERARINLVSVVDRCRNSGEFDSVHPARWRHLKTGHHVETGYSYGEGRVRVFLVGGRAVSADYVISGRDDDLDEFLQLFPVSST